MSLHMVFTTAGLSSCQKRCQAGDAIILIGDGIYAATSLDSSIKVHALAEDATIRGITLPEQIVAISYDALVEMCTSHKPIVSWND